MPNLFPGATPLLLVGAGKMGGAMLARWLELGLDRQYLTIVDPVLDPATYPGVTVVPSLDQVTITPAVVLLAVKPQTMAKVLEPLQALLTPETVVISIAAGTRIATFAQAFPTNPIVRVMPNTPAQVGRAMSVAVGNAHVRDANRATVTALLDAIGKTAWVDEEDQIDAVTAVSGSGPAYVFHLVEALAEAARAIGLAPELADLLARQTITGAGELLHQSPETAQTLRINVTSPGGTTAAALHVLMGEDALTKLVTKAVVAAKARATELGS